MKKDSSAYKAGIREGQPLKGYGLHFGQMNQEAEIVVEVEGKIKSVKYFPKGKSEEKIPQFYLKSH